MRALESKFHQQKKPKFVVQERIERHCFTLSNKIYLTPPNSSSREHINASQENFFISIVFSNVDA
jgi:hypothetical protein